MIYIMIHLKMFQYLFNMFEKKVKLNGYEIGVLLSALRSLSTSDRLSISNEYGSIRAIYDRLEEVYKELDTTEIDREILESYNTKCESPSY